MGSNCNSVYKLIWATGKLLSQHLWCNRNSTQYTCKFSENLGTLVSILPDRLNTMNMLF
jgi:hypothetical protein